MLRSSSKPCKLKYTRCVPKKRPLFYFFNISYQKWNFGGFITSHPLPSYSYMSGLIGHITRSASRLSILHNPYLLLSAGRKHNKCRRRARSATNQQHASLVLLLSIIRTEDGQTPDGQTTDHYTAHDPHTMQASSIISFLTLGNVAKIKFSHPKTVFIYGRLYSSQ